MTKLLTIGIPTFNRAQLLDRQLAWLAQAVKGFESECEIIVSDNCSSDDTPEVVKKWESHFSNTALKLNRNSENVGAIRNIAYCITPARWIVSRIHLKTWKDLTPWETTLLAGKNGPAA